MHRISSCIRLKLGGKEPNFNRHETKERKLWQLKRTLCSAKSGKRIQVRVRRLISLLLGVLTLRPTRRPCLSRLFPPPPSLHPIPPLSPDKDPFVKNPDDDNLGDSPAASGVRGRASADSTSSSSSDSDVSARPGGGAGTARGGAASESSDDSTARPRLGGGVQEGRGWEQ